MHYENRFLTSEHVVVVVAAVVVVLVVVIEWLLIWNQEYSNLIGTFAGDVLTGNGHASEWNHNIAFTVVLLITLSYYVSRLIYGFRWKLALNFIDKHRKTIIFV